MPSSRRRPGSSFRFSATLQDQELDPGFRRDDEM